MKVLLSAVDVSAMLAAQWNLSPEDVSVSGIEELAVEIPASLLGLSTPSQPAKTTRKAASKKPDASTSSTKDKTPKERKVEDELAEMEEIANAVEDKKEETTEEKSDIDDFLDEDEDIDFN